jgi:hypothetical protein
MSDPILAKMIHMRLRELNYPISKLNLVCLKNSDRKGSPLPQSEYFLNDRSIILKIENGEAEVLFNEMARAGNILDTIQQYDSKSNPPHPRLLHERFLSVISEWHNEIDILSTIVLDTTKM